MHYLTILTVFVIVQRRNYSSPDQMVGKILSPFTLHVYWLITSLLSRHRSFSISNEACKVDQPLVSRKVTTYAAYSSSWIEICRMFTQLSASNLYFSSCFSDFMFASVEWLSNVSIVTLRSESIVCVRNWNDWSRERSLVVSEAYFFVCNPGSPPKIREIKDNYSRKT